MTKSVLAKAVPAVSTAVSYARGPLDERSAVRPESARPAPRNVPSELVVLLGEIERLNAALRAEQAKVKALQESADTDALTGLFNRRGFDRELKRSVSYVKRYWTRAALAYVDLDRFKPINDRYGHAAGDAVLRAVAATLARNVRASDTVGRLGGDEFGVILWNLGEADAAKKARALEAAIAELRIAWEGEALSVSASIGFAMIGPSDELADTLAAADRAMYARKAGRRRGR